MVQLSHPYMITGKNIALTVWIFVSKVMSLFFTTKPKFVIENSKKKKIYFYFFDYAKLLYMWITTNCGKFSKRWKYQNTLPASSEICMKIRKQQLEPDMKQ